MKQIHEGELILVGSTPLMKDAQICRPVVWEELITPLDPIMFSHHFRKGNAFLPSHVT